ncbi:1,3-beta-glucan synthase component-domain-containing protein [Gymnopilus junonius]|uniref:1,3-beta-glucan synthase component-domain-containing protein n=1 Tax=Gymnopilus junonius TaxID=109634 RepID=A0A9P5N714_GYMJU|nr:1,3-beta-glucan synthase component-domain-containing protein [Gymnopilus junonius]
MQNVLAEFEEYAVPSLVSVWALESQGLPETSIAIIGILVGLATSKEQMFGTHSARGGISKAQKGLLLNEDIYAFGREGEIEHTAALVVHYQCSTDRDLGFGTILNFQTKIGLGRIWGEQLSSEQYVGYFVGAVVYFDE